ncbi:hypothetical protein TRFO_15017 [Tritrichomonas foetus]|uniref:Tubby C-terminal domain-containing protein n=1 Tax=Tritrichomonas foetus TaxID=1144522 RepID=A0A1J4KTH7_9EUKA|nr:hypothetical protein TRFO_15017 [Tritrichomonas foetus]|eukprot:OHT14601.1 hypothetical protein TRFO_15017 [Tritrichomonas foetus]
MLGSPQIENSRIRSLRDITSVPVRGPKGGKFHKFFKNISTPNHHKIIDGHNDENDIYNKQNSRKSGFNTFSCIRSGSKNKTFYFIANDSGVCLYTAIHNNETNAYKIYKSLVIHKMAQSHQTSGNHSEIAYLLYSNDFCDFSLRENLSNDDHKADSISNIRNNKNNRSKRNNNNNREILAIQFRRFKNVMLAPRKLSLYFFNQSETMPSFLKNADPDLASFNKWKLDLNSENVVKSIKNCKIENEQHKTFGYIRKCGKNELEIEAREDIDDLRLFAMTIASFMCKK